MDLNLEPAVWDKLIDLWEATIYGPTFLVAAERERDFEEIIKAEFLKSERAVPYGQLRALVTAEVDFRYKKSNRDLRNTPKVR